jgi:death-on-curing protein
MAGAYLYHLAKNHGFVDGNKRAGAAAALMFLALNGLDTDLIDDVEMERVVWAVADGSCGKDAATAFFRQQLN